MNFTPFVVFYLLSEIETLFYGYKLDCTAPRCAVFPDLVLPASARSLPFGPQSFASETLGVCANQQ